MNILLVTSEAVPFAKTGGLADVCGALPAELERQGHNVAVMLPAYRQVYRSGLAIEPTGIEIEVPIGSKSVTGSLALAHLPDSRVPVYLVEKPQYYDRDGLYGDNGDYIDNCERFVFFCRMVMESIRRLNLNIDVIHANDWQTGLVPAYLATEYRGVPGYENIATLFTIHNLAYQGTFWHWDMLLTGMDWKYFNWRQMEFWGNLNLLKTALVFADAISTVSPRYAEEIQTTPLGAGLEGVLQSRRDVLTGIVNGADYRHWDPAIDPHLPVQYGPGNVAKGKAACKRALQAQLGLPQSADVPVVGIVGRLAEQKGIDLVAEALPEWVKSLDAQWAILGTGDAKYHDLLQHIAQRHPQKVAVRLEFSDALAHLIEGGADMFLMPSRYEPCGLNQLYSLKYGTVPIVRLTGGLADTVTDATEETLAAGTATGFGFQEYSVLALSQTMQRAMEMYRNRPEDWRRIQQTGMGQDWSWAHAAREYVQLYQRIVARRRQTVAAR
jgi:starch synthase